ncbi:FadR/GntR family transcriptional regulator [Sporosarcina obsidiansis]|uniref:FadR/GntR family transcriptional regulator n=1 Tax=Sporosarcina obsidiansis TaxID=2660748 RepID=UPI00129A5156|nr:FadR/GntR family transcriptional regulator [Sporosarcina obsidiansis]
MSYDQLKSVGTFKNIEAKKLSNYIFEQLQEAIVLKELLPGEQLPPERELCKIFNTSRITMREAIAVLKEEGFIEQIRGAKGGTFILPLTTQNIERTRSKVLSDKEKYLQLFEYRSVIEPEVARLAVKNISENELKILSSINEEMKREKNREEFRSLDVQFHLMLGKCSKNQYFEQAVRMIRLQVNPVLDILPFNDVVHEKSYMEHIQLLEAIESGNAEQAYKSMAIHINTTNSKLFELL